MKIKEIVEKVEKSEAFREWKKQHKDSFLVHLFMMYDEKESYQVGYYDKKKDMITSFSVDDEIMASPESEVFKKEKTVVKRLDIKKVKKDFEDAVSIANKFQREKYSTEIPIKKIVVLQNIDFGQIWNITFISKTFNTLNMKIDAGSGKVKKHELVSLFSMGK